MSALFLGKVIITTSAGTGVAIATDVYGLVVYLLAVVVIMGFVVPYAAGMRDAFQRARLTVAADLATPARPERRLARSARGHSCSPNRP